MVFERFQENNLEKNRSGSTSNTELEQKKEGADPHCCEQPDSPPAPVGLRFGGFGPAGLGCAGGACTSAFCKICNTFCKIYNRFCKINNGSTPHHRHVITFTNYISHEWTEW